MTINYSLPFINSTYLTDMFSLMNYFNLVTDNVFGVSLVFTFGVISLWTFIVNAGFKNGVTSGGFVTWVLTVILGVGQVIQSGVVVSVSLLYFSWLGYLIYSNYVK